MRRPGQTKGLRAVSRVDFRVLGTFWQALGEPDAGLGGWNTLLEDLKQALGCLGALVQIWRSSGTTGQGLRVFSTLVMGLGGGS